MTTQLADTDRYSTARFLLAHPAIRDPHIYWPALVGFLTDQLDQLAAAHRDTCLTIGCPTCDQLDQAAALVDAHAELAPAGWDCTPAEVDSL